MSCREAGPFGAEHRGGSPPSLVGTIDTSEAPMIDESLLRTAPSIPDASRVVSAVAGRRSVAAWWPCLLASVTLMTMSGRAAEPEWHEAWATAATEARHHDRPILIFFTGSDWCPHCRLLEQDVLASETFRDWATDRYVLLEIDLPKQGLSKDVRDERAALCKRFGVRSFPYVMLVRADGEPLAGLKGYSKQSPDEWIASINSQFDQFAIDRVGLPGPSDVAADAAPASVEVNAPMRPRPEADALAGAVERARRNRRPLLVVVSRASDDMARDLAASLIVDPTFRRLVDRHFELVIVQSPMTGTDASDPKPVFSQVDALLGGVALPEHEVEVIVTHDGQTPLHSQSGRQPSPRIVSRLRHYLAATGGLPSGPSTR